MKRLLLIALLAMSPMTFAKDVNADSLVGTWQCKSESSFGNGTAHYSELDKQVFYKDGTYLSEDIMYDKNLGETFELKTTGKWYVKNRLLNMNIEDVLTLTTDKPFYTDINDLKKDIINNRKFSQLIIKEFSKDEFVLTLSKQDQKEFQGNSIETCQRIK